jgi:endonuclease YncB( thermonuclease family)
LLSSRFQWSNLAFFCAISVTFAAKADDRSPCFSKTLGSFPIAHVADGRSFKLGDGREVLLAGIEVPDGADDATAKAALERLIAGKDVVLKQAEPANDRYGRLLAQAFVPQDGAERWIQQDLLAAGRAQVAARPGDAACAKALLAAEAPARQSKREIWADSAYGIKASEDLPGLLERRGRFTVAEGRVVSVRESGGTIYVNFGRVWSRNLTVTILGRNKRAFESAGIDLKKLVGARLRVRGWVEERGGPRIEAARPEQIEIAARD